MNAISMPALLKNNTTSLWLPSTRPALAELQKIRAQYYIDNEAFPCKNKENMEETL